MASDSVTVNRQALHELVWSHPTSVLAKRCGISGRGLGKICVRCKIPVYRRRWWAKKQHGHRVKTAPLPALKDGGPPVVYIHKQDRPTPPPEPITPPEIAYESRPENQIVVPDRITRFHPLIRHTRAALKAA